MGAALLVISVAQGWGSEGQMGGIELGKRVIGTMGLYAELVQGLRSYHIVVTVTRGLLPRSHSRLSAEDFGAQLVAKSGTREHPCERPRGFLPEFGGPGVTVNMRFVFERTRDVQDLRELRISYRGRAVRFPIPGPQRKKVTVPVGVGPLPVTYTVSWTSVPWEVRRPSSTAW